MLRVKKTTVAKSAIHIVQGTPSNPESDKIYHDFKDPYLELIRLLKEAAGLEHLLMLQYLYAAFSIKDKYEAVRGIMGPQYYLDSVTDNLFGVAIEEMQHLRMVNQFLSALGASPNMIAQEFDEVSDIYPFQLELKPLTRYTTATYLYVEANKCALNLVDTNCFHTEKDKEYINDVLKVLNNTPTNHIGSLYSSIITFAKKVSRNPPDFLKNKFIDFNKYENFMLTIMDQGEEAHYQFFKNVFTASHPGFHGLDVWKLDPGSEDYPSIQFDTEQTTAYEGQKNVIKNESDRKVGWLSNLHYWIILSLLDLNYRTTTQKPKYKAIGNMTEALYSLGFFLAGRGIGIPFDPPSIGPNFGKDETFYLEILKLMVLEAQQLAFELKSELPATFNFSVYKHTLDGLTDL